MSFPRKKPLFEYWPEWCLTTLLGTAAFLGARVAPFCFNRKKVHRLTNVPYSKRTSFGAIALDPRAHFLDVFLPEQKPTREIESEEGPTLEKKGALTPKYPIALFIHGGGFGFFSKASHAAAAGALAETGVVVFSINYSLIPKYPFPSGFIDSVLAYEWMIKNAAQYDGDLNRISVIGESAGANFALSLCLYLFGIRNLEIEGAEKLPLLQTKPKHAVIHCGLLQVTEPERYGKKVTASRLIRSRVRMIFRQYLTRSQLRESKWDLANPLLVLEKMAESGEGLPEGFPEIFVPVGAIDPVRDDSDRLGAVLEKLGQKERLRIYPGEMHAFYTSPFKTQTKQFWRDVSAFSESLNLASPHLQKKVFTRD
jgi:acetyl esterase